MCDHGCGGGRSTGGYGPRAPASPSPEAALPDRTRRNRRGARARALAGPRPQRRRAAGPRRAATRAPHRQQPRTRRRADALRVGLELRLRRQPGRDPRDPRGARPRRRRQDTRRLRLDVRIRYIAGRRERARPGLEARRVLRGRRGAVPRLVQHPGARPRGRGGDGRRRAERRGAQPVHRPGGARRVLAGHAARCASDRRAAARAPSRRVALALHRSPALGDRAHPAGRVLQLRQRDRPAGLLEPVPRRGQPRPLQGRGLRPRQRRGHHASLHPRRRAAAAARVRAPDPPDRRRHGRQQRRLAGVPRRVVRVVLGVGLRLASGRARARRPAAAGGHAAAVAELRRAARRRAERPRRGLGHRSRGVDGGQRDHGREPHPDRAAARGPARLGPRRACRLVAIGGRCPHDRAG